MTAKSPAKGTTKKHAAPSSAAKHAAHVKHEAHLAHLAHLKAIGKAPKVTVKAAAAKPAKAAKARSFAIGDLLPVCAFEAVAQSLRLAGQRVDPDDVGQLWTLADARPEGVSIGEALAAAVGLARQRPVRVDLVSDLDERGGGVAGFLGADVVDAFQGSEHLDLRAVDVGHGPHLAERGGVDRPLVSAQQLGDALLGHALILGIDRPGPHAVLATPDGWWSWGELHDPWPCQVEEAWAVSWS